jgi:hypothetical protein
MQTSQGHLGQSLMLGLVLVVTSLSVLVIASSF